MPRSLVRHLATLLLCCCALVAGREGRADDDGGGTAAAPGAAAAPSSAPGVSSAGGQAQIIGTSVFRQIIASGLSPAQKSQLQAQGFQILADKNNGLLQKQVTLLQVPVSGLVGNPVAQVRSLGPLVRADENHLYRTGASSMTTARDAAPRSRPDASAIACPTTLLLAMIDTAVDASHPALRGARVEVNRVVQGPDKGQAPADHGTAVASLLVGQTAAAPGVVPQARLLAIDAFHKGRLGDQRMDAYDLAAALDVAARRDAKVINMSFDGPPNTIVEEAIERLHRRGVILVAAVGNGGPLAPPGYPAAYPQVLAVTAVGQNLEVYRHASRGPHVAFAARGVDRPAAGPKDAVASVSGTSFAAPTVSGLVAHAAQRGLLTAASVEKTLARKTQDLGNPGRDEVFGYGFLDPSQLCVPGAR